MNNLFELSLNYSGVLPSGVSFELRELLTGDQSDLAKRVKAGNKTAFKKMLADCIVRLGDNTDVKVADLNKMLSHDINYAYVQLRNHTFRNNEDDTFKFKYEFPLQPGESNKHTETFTINFNQENFKTVPYVWVTERMAELADTYMKENPEAKEYVKNYDTEFPKMYDNYDAMLAEQQNRKFTFPSTEVTISWRIIDGGAEEGRRVHFGHKEDFIAALYMRQAKINRTFKDTGEDLAEAVDWESIPLYYSDKFRSEIQRVEGLVDTTITVTSEKNPSKVARINLIQTVAFFAPSLGN